MAGMFDGELMENTGIANIEAGQITFEMARSRYDVLKQVVEQSLIEGEDYGTLPGVPEPYLKKTGAEKLMAMFDLRPDPSLQHPYEDWEKGIFFYRYKVTIYRGKEIVGACEGGCTNQEDKFKFRWIEADPPEDKLVEAEMKRAKTGRWRMVNDQWQWQEKEEVANPYDQINSVIRRAQKRPMVGAVQVAFAASGFFAKAGKKEKERKTRTVADDGPKRFATAARASGIKYEDSKVLAGKAASGEISWDDAIAGLPK